MPFETRGYPYKDPCEIHFIAYGHPSGSLWNTLCNPLQNMPGDVVMFRGVVSRLLVWGFWGVNWRIPVTCLPFFFSLYAFGTVPSLSSFVTKPMEIPSEPCDISCEIPLQNLWKSIGTPLKYRVECLSKPMDIPRDPCETPFRAYGYPSGSLWNTVHFAILFKTYNPFPYFLFFRP